MTCICHHFLASQSISDISSNKNMPQNPLSASISTFNTNNHATLPATPQASSPPHQALSLSYYHGSTPASSQGLSYCISDTYTSFPSTPLPPSPPRTTTYIIIFHSYQFSCRPTPPSILFYYGLPFYILFYWSYSISRPSTIHIIIIAPSSFLSTLLAFNESALSL